MTPANGLHGLNPKNTGRSSPAFVPCSLFARDCATSQVKVVETTCLGMNGFLKGLWAYAGRGLDVYPPFPDL